MTKTTYHFNEEGNLVDSAGRLVLDDRYFEHDGNGGIGGEDEFTDSGEFNPPVYNGPVVGELGGLEWSESHKPPEGQEDGDNSPQPSRT